MITINGYKLIVKVIVIIYSVFDTDINSKFVPGIINIKITVLSLLIIAILVSCSGYEVKCKMIIYM